MVGEIYDQEISNRTKPGMFSVMFLPRTDDCLWLAIMATPTHLIVFAHVLLLFKDGYSFFCRAPCVVTNWAAASIRINTVVQIHNPCLTRQLHS